MLEMTPEVPETAEMEHTVASKGRLISCSGGDSVLQDIGTQFPQTKCNPPRGQRAGRTPVEAKGR